MKKVIRYAILLSLSMCLSISVVHAMEILADFGDSNGTPVLYDGAKFKINRISVDINDTENNRQYSGIYDVTFVWDEHQFVLIPIEVSGCYNGALRVHVTDAITGEPLTNAHVSIDGKDENTDEDGNVYFRELDNKQVMVQVEAEGYVQAGFEVGIACNQTMRTGVTLMPTTQVN